MKSDKKRVGVVGCGNISPVYLGNLPRFGNLEVVACADLIPERMLAAAKKYDVPRACTTAELLAMGEIDMVLNITQPAAHAGVALAALNAGKSVYGEKPMALTREEGRAILETARARGLRVGNAPDTFLGGGPQTARKLIDDGVIGRPVAATAFMVCHGHENWHPDPEFLYQRGGGPMFDMGPYYLTAMVSLMGPVRRVTGATRITFPERVITSQPKAGARIAVEIPTHVVGVLEFASGAIGTIVTSYDVWGAQVPFIEIHGADASLSLNDPNYFSGPLRLMKAGAKEWAEVPLTHGPLKESRGLGMADMAAALRSGRPHRASGEMGFHILDIMCAIHDAAREGRHVTLQSTCERPAPMPAGLSENGLLD